MTIESRVRRALRSSGVLIRDAAVPAARSGVDKVFAIGFNKTASSSIHQVFADVGLHSYHGERWRKTSDRALFHLFDAFCDGIPDDFVVLSERFPRARFILQVRELDRWLNSRLEHIERRPAWRTNVISEDWRTDDDAVMQWVVQRNDYHRAVLDHFRGQPERLLVVNFIRDADSADRIAAFLGRPEPAEKPHVNRNAKGGSGPRHAEKIARCLERLGVPPEEWSCDIACRSLLDECDRDRVPGDSNELPVHVPARRVGDDIPAGGRTHP